MALSKTGKKEIVKLFADIGYQVHPEAIPLLKKYEGSLQRLVEDVKKVFGDSLLVIERAHVEKLLERKVLLDLEQVGGTAPAPRIIKSFNDSSRQPQQPQMQLQQLFLDRYKRISKILKARINARPIKRVKSGDSEVSVIGLVSSVAKTRKGNVIAELEDPTGTIPVIFQKDVNLLLDEVVGVTGRLTKDHRYLIAERIVYPEVPLYNEKREKIGNGSEGHKALFISDMHFGSKQFLEERWNRFIDWLKRRTDISYVVVAGDVVDGIGIYPRQEEELLIKDIYEQYELAAAYLREIRHAHIIISPGNHDAVRQAEPQPPLSGEIAEMFPKNVHFVSSPATFEIAGRHIVVYHGQSFDDIIGEIPGLSYEEPLKLMMELLRRRHLAPIYGKSVPILPQGGEDHAVIESVPDVLHCGHSHTVGVARYRGVLLINSGTWQAQTKYQKKRSIEPVPCRATLVDLTAMRAKVLNFAAAS
ncbi:DNA-directed DNA polymerase II small subunit [Candidatus Alkanophaga liquidiphilum]